MVSDKKKWPKEFLPSLLLLGCEPLVVAVSASLEWAALRRPLLSAVLQPKSLLPLGYFRGWVTGGQALSRPSDEYAVSLSEWTGLISSPPSNTTPRSLLSHWFPWKCSFFWRKTLELVQKLLLFKKPLQTTARGKQDLEIIGRKIIVRTKSKIIDPHLITSFYSDGGGLLPATADVISLLANGHHS